MVVLIFIRPSLSVSWGWVEKVRAERLVGCGYSLVGNVQMFVSQFEKVAVVEVLVVAEFVFSSVAVLRPLLCLLEAADDDR